MCGRYATTRSAADLAMLFEAVDTTPGLAPRYNVAPTDPAPLVRLSWRAQSRVLAVGHWGLFGSARMINARAETVRTARAYAEAFATRRALVPADGWYEWRRESARKQAYFLTPADGSVLALGGLWSRWGPDRRLTFSVVTTAATGALAAVHDRMPLLLPPQLWWHWLAGDDAASLLGAPPSEELPGLEVRPVGPAVGNVRNDDPDLTTRVDLSPEPPPLW